MKTIINIVKMSTCRIQAQFDEVMHPETFSESERPGSPDSAIYLEFSAEKRA